MSTDPKDTTPEQLGLYDQPFEATGPAIIHVAHVAGRAKREARARVEPYRSGMRGKIWEWLSRFGPADRLTVARALGLKENSVNARVAELVAQKAARVELYDASIGRGLVFACVPPKEGETP